MLIVRVELPPLMTLKEREEALRVVDLHLTAAQGDGKMRGELVEGGLIVAGSR